MAPEPVADVGGDAVRRSILRQRWHDVVFLHWPVEATAVRRLLPPYTAPDIIDGSAWVGVIGLRMTGLRFGGLPYPEFRELNVRLYSVDEDGRRGVVFRTLEATDPAFAAMSRVSLGLQYTWADISYDRSASVIGYRTARRYPRPVGAGVRFRGTVGEPIPPSDLEIALTARWALHQGWYGRTLRIPVAHEPWPLRRVELLDWYDSGLFAACGLPTPDGPPHSALYAGAVTARFGSPTPVRPNSIHPA